jgi:hypothetical protein
MGLSGVGLAAKWLRGVDLNHRPLGYEPNELPGCSTPHYEFNNAYEGRSICSLFQYKMSLKGRYDSNTR